MVLQLYLSSLSLFSTVLRQVVFGRPLLRLPSGVQCIAILAMLLLAFRITWPIHLHLLLLTSVRISSCLIHLSSWSFDIFWDQKILRIFLTLAVWKDASFERSCSVIRQHSDLKLIKAFLAMFNLLCISSLVPPSWQSTLPKYVNLMVYGMSCPLTLIFVGERTLTHMASVFFKLILKPTWLLNMLSKSVFSWMCCCGWDNRVKSSAKSRSSCIVKGVHLMPLCWSSIVRQRTQSIAILNSMDDMTHPCRTPVLTSKLRSPWQMHHVKFE